METRITPQEVHSIIKKFTIGDGHNIVVDTEKSHGSWIVDALTGKEYLDCYSQFASQPIGWNHPKLINELNRFTPALTCKIANSDLYTIELAEFIQDFSEIASDFSHFFFIDGGALAVENALKTAFDYKAQKMGLSDIANVDYFDVIHLEQSFHGRSGYTLSLTNTIPNKVALFPKFQWTRIKNPKIKFPIGRSETTNLSFFAKRNHIRNYAKMLITPHFTS
jgi:L-lysine 6-transaminase